VCLLKLGGFVSSLNIGSWGAAGGRGTMQIGSAFARFRFALSAMLPLLALLPPSLLRNGHVQVGAVELLGMLLLPPLPQPLRRLLVGRDAAVLSSLQPVAKDASKISDLLWLLKEKPSKELAEVSLEAR